MFRMIFIKKLFSWVSNKMQKQIIILKKRLKKYRPLVGILNRIYGTYKFLINKIRGSGMKRAVNIYNNKNRPANGHALLMYIAHPFFMNENDPGFRSHINIQCSLTIVKVLNELGYIVDVIDYTDQEFDTKRQYDIVIGIGGAFDYKKEYFTNSQIKIYLATGIHWLTETYLIYQRHFNLKNRKKITLIPRRINEAYFSPEKSDVIFSVQNEYTNNTYSHLTNPIYPLALSGSFDSPPSAKNIKKKNTRTFLWLSGGGMVLKGLDIVLEAFSEMPDFKLKVCTNVSSEKDFEQLYFKELYETKNIQTYGFVDIGNEKFQDIVSECVAVIFPYPEGEISGSIVNSMYYGLIPIIGYFSNDEIKEFAELVDGSVDGIKRVLLKFGELTDQDIMEKSSKTLYYVQKYHSQTKEYNDWKSAFEDVINKYNKSR
ncbi:hypothetical protein CVT91_05710 [Candidatus Atribacteria bacterium HGW-Atribacteria-1]|nr:MAG: hypothetical protein CVT91_05710 [Candidatus Atribacteria bacterium HGW-Atribacteria-1]